MSPLPGWIHRHSSVHCLLLLLLAWTPVSTAAETAQESSLVLFNWDAYIDPALLERYHRETGTRVMVQAYDTDESKDHELAATDRGEGFDLIIGSGVSLRSLAESGWLAELPEADMPQLKNLHARWRDAYQSVRAYAVPYFWGTMGIAYRSDRVQPPRGWQDFFEPAPGLQGSLMLIDDSKDAFGAALKMLGYSMISDDPDQLRAALKVLQAVRPHLRDIGYFGYGPDSVLATGEVLMAMAYSGDVLTLQENVPTVKYFVPPEGTNLWVDYIAVFASSPKRDAAFRLIDFLNQPDVAAQNARFVHYATPNAAAEKLLEPEFLADPILYPPAEVLDRSETYEEMSTLATRQRTRLFSQIRD